MRPKDPAETERLAAAIADYARHVRPLRGLRNDAHVESLAGQMQDSVRRIQYVKVQLQRPHDPARADPGSDIFDPILGAIVRKSEGDLEEAAWLTFLSTHCGKHLRLGWRLSKLIYAGGGKPWTWQRISADPALFRVWVGKNQTLLAPDGRAGFGNHRKYESLRANSARPTGRVIESYAKWIEAAGGHEALFDAVVAESGGNRGEAFDLLYQKADAILGFGRMGRFDFLTMLGKLELADIEPAIPYMTGATGPQAGARLLFYGNARATAKVRDLDKIVAEFGQHIGLGMQVMEDSICNWQKSPGKFRAFRG
jgi:hypothetical protein